MAAATSTATTAHCGDLDVENEIVREEWRGKKGALSNE
jgi:hypothetical protein